MDKQVKWSSLISSRNLRKECMTNLRLSASWDELNACTHKVFMSWVEELPVQNKHQISESQWKKKVLVYKYFHGLFNPLKLMTNFSSKEIKFQSTSMLLRLLNLNVESPKWYPTVDSALTIILFEKQLKKDYSSATARSRDPSGNLKKILRNISPHFQTLRREEITRCPNRVFLTSFEVF